MERNVIAKKTTITGDISSEGDFRIDGILEGTLKTNGRVIIGSGGFVNGKVDALNADIEGKISGKLEVKKTLTVKAAADISGEVIVGKLSIEPGAAFNATCVMRVVPEEDKKQNETNKKGEKQQNKKQQAKAKKTFK
ncbi:bactofilin family protein [Polaribacter marinivivus]|uniref:Polymer-forming cytoskeletal protein n=1 Tax=Polaribacter marinivivus TaxID=1524260 RepID=A0ABV8R6D3_9FLAO